MPRRSCAKRTGWWRARTAPASWTRARASSEMKRRPAHRPERLAELIRQTVAAFLTGNVRDPRIGFVTVTGVEVSADLSHATVSVSIMGTEEEKATSFEGLASAARFLRAQLSQELRLRTSPELHFRLDRGLEHAQRIEQVLRELKGSGGGGGGGRRGPRRSASRPRASPRPGPASGGSPSTPRRPIRR